MREVAATVVHAVIVVVPHGQMSHLFTQPGVTRDAVGRLVGAPEVGRIGGVEVAIDVVAGKDEKLRPIGENGLPDRLWLGLVRAGAEGDARQRRSPLRSNGEGRQRGCGHELGEGAAVEHGATEMTGLQV